jgi:hypothetical protein
MSRKKSKEPDIDDDNPEWTEEDFAKAVRIEGGLKAKDITPEILEQIKNARPGQTIRPKSAKSKPN